MGAYWHIIAKLVDYFLFMSLLTLLSVREVVNQGWIRGHNVRGQGQGQAT